MSARPAARAATTNRSELGIGDAFDFLQMVRLEYASDQRVYQDFLVILDRFRAREISLADVCEQVAALFDGRPQLLAGFRRFLPAGTTLPG
mmetsp:Transcript_6390/g.16355  ORF Transcript_6390/g.16355 Transcript_6390/m.16355 type:complete len:91 (+) Transcript_6390:69-341(+)